MPLDAVQSRAQAHHDLGERRDKATQPKVVSGEYVRTRILGIGKEKFYALVRSGRIAHCLSLNLSTARRQYYVLSKIEQWATETPDVRKRVR